MTQGVTYITPMCILYCILHIRMPLRCAVVAAVSGYGGVFYASGGSGLAKTRLKSFMILTPLLIMRIWFRRSLECSKKLVKTQWNMKVFLFGLVTSYYTRLALVWKNAISPLRNAHFFAGRGRTLGPPRLFYRSLGCRFCLGGGGRVMIRC